MSDIKLSVGQNIWLVKTSYRGTLEEPIEVKISKVGRKYFELEGFTRERFNIETLIEENVSNYKNRCYLTLLEILDEREHGGLVSKIRKYFTGYGKVDLTLDQLRKINEVIIGKS